MSQKKNLAKIFDLFFKNPLNQLIDTYAFILVSVILH